MNLREIGHALRKQRIALGMTQNELAELTGIVRPRITKIEGGKYKNVGSETIFKLVDQLGLEVKVISHM